MDSLTYLWYGCATWGKVSCVKNNPVKIPDYKTQNSQFNAVNWGTRSRAAWLVPTTCRKKLLILIFFKKFLSST